jgi:phage FluMu protein Com
MEFEVNEECIFFQPKPRCCKALNHLYCKTEECAFYKSRNKYDDKGEEKTDE